MSCRYVGNGIPSVKQADEGRLGAVLYPGVAMGSDSGVGTTSSEQSQVESHKEL